ncbi:hypothetical protein BC941DRAFT_154006 [Chlamydoabsidia padenii]|nr:hypothetical protein BC941DRAFT_154006 [Chlamydoabsidia padenii]
MAMTLRWHSCSKEDYPYRRHKVPQACDKCRAKKMRCNGKLPCDRCELTKMECTYSIKKTTNSATKRILGNNSNKVKPSLRHVSTAEDSGTSNLSTSLPSSPKQPPRQQQLPQVFDPHLLKHMSFKSDYYNVIRNTSATSCLGTSQLPPLLFGFFSLSCQPYATWTTFIQLFRQHNNNHSNQQSMGTVPTLSTELSHEIMSLFGSHNYLYSAFMDMTQVMSFLTRSPNDLQQQQSSTTLSQSVIVNSIIALVFQAANQSLSHCCPEWSPLLQKQASLFYQHAHQLFITMTYPSSGKPLVALDSTNLLDLTRASILLTHYQCVAISEEQAYMTLQMGLGYAHRLGLYDITPCGNVKQMDCFKVLQKVLSGWQLWFSIYLNRCQPSSLLIHQDDTNTASCKSQVKMENYLGKKGNQRWAVDVLDVYIQFFTKIINASEKEPLTQLDIQHHLKQMELWSSTFYSTRLNFTDIHSNNKSSHNNYTSSSRVRASQHLPAYVLSLYHQTLSIQLLQTQQPHLLSTSLMSSPVPSSPRRTSHDDQSPTLPASQHDTMEQRQKEWDNNDDDEANMTEALTRSATIILDIVDEILVGDSDAHLLVGFGNRDSVHSFVVYPLIVVTALLPTLALSVRQSLAVLPTYDNVIQKRQRYFIQQCSVLDDQISRLSNLLVSSQLPFTNYLLQSIQGIISIGGHVVPEKRMETKGVLPVSVRSTLSPTPSSSSSSSSLSSSASTIPSSSSALPATTTTTINRLLDKSSSKPDVTQERLMAIPTMDFSSRLVTDQQLLDKLSLSKGISSSFSPSFTAAATHNNKRKLDSTLEFKKKQKVTATTTKAPVSMGETTLGMSYQQQLQLQPSYQQNFNDTFSAASMTTRYLDQLNGLSEQSQLQQIYSTDCLTDDNLWMAIVGNSSLASSPPRRSRLPTDNNNDTPKLPLPHIKHKNTAIPKSWSAAGAHIKVDWNVCFSAEVNRTLHQNGAQQPISGLDIATDPTIQLDTPSNQDNVLYLLSQPQHRQSGDTGFFPTSSTWDSVDSSFF